MFITKIEVKKLAEIPTMLQQHKDLVIERDRKIEEAKQQIIDEYDKILKEHQKNIHKEVDAKIRGLS